ncbi:MAG: D-alanine--D-alanine ligase [Thermaerobacter sp.]|nr:D-alanine--D-alanine ligase [Thermaerobacter sp.]
MALVRVLVMMGGPSNEHDVSLASGEMVFKALAARPEMEVKALTIGRDGQWRLADAPDHAWPKPGAAGGQVVPRAYAIDGVRLLAEADVAFLAFHGSFGEDGTLQGLMEAMGLAYTGSGPLASALAMNKAKAKEMLGLYGLAVPRAMQLSRRVLSQAMENSVAAVEANLPYPLVVKPNAGGSSVGVRLAPDREQLRAALEDAAQYDLDVLVEEKLVGREMTCAVLEEFDGSVRALPVIEIVPKKGAFFDFASKYEDAGADEICPAQITDEEAAAIQQAAVRAHQALGCQGFSRTDMFLTARGPVVLEVNTIPGMTPNSLLPKAARAAGIAFDALMAHLIELARLRQTRRLGKD